MTLPKSLEIIANSDISLNIFNVGKPEFIAVATMKYPNREKPVHIIGPSGDGVLNFSFNAANKRRYQLKQFQQTDLGVMTATIVTKKDIEIYELHQRKESLPKDLKYEEVSMTEYAIRIK
ncbi:MAG: hypothetical protein Q8Q42_01335 [Nanoarchaeota archaeon]|nr:hypothetical protein [Nanoarchaeota archaeon]